MSQIHEKIRSLDSTNHELVKETLAQLFQKLSRDTDSDHASWLVSLETIITRFPKFCLPHRNVIEDYLIQFLDSENQNLVIKAAKCCHALQQVKSSNEKTANAKSSWRQQMSLLCSTAHSVLGAAFADAVDIYKVSGYFQKPETEENASSGTPIGVALSELVSPTTKLGNKTNKDYVTLSPAQKHLLLCNRLKNVLIFTQAMLVEVYPVSKPVRPQMILDVIVRALSITSSTKQVAVKETDKLAFCKNIASVKVQALRTLDALIVCLGSNLIPYSPLVFRLATQTLRWSSDNATKESMEVRRTCYSTLTLWLGVLRCHKLEGEAARGRGTALDEELLSAVLADISPKLNTVQLTMSNQSMKNLSKKARRKMANTILNQSAIASHIPGEKNKEQVIDEDPGVVLAALQCLEVLLITCGIFLKPTMHKRVQDCLVRACYTIDSSVDAARGVATCRALEASRLCVPSNVPPPTHHCLNIYSRLANSTHYQISQFCSQAVLSVRISLHAPPTLNYPATPLQRENEMERTAVVSERNRAALANLLGEDKLPPPKLTDEIINLNDSPVRKRKAEEDKISVSSQSSTEVQIDESNGIDLDSPESDFGEIVTNDETDCSTKFLLSNGKMRLLDFDKKNKAITEENIHEIKTQLPENITNHSVAIADDDSSHSIEISYDHNSNNDDKVKFLEKLDGDNLPSTGETDDVQITCGQTVKSSQDSAKSVGDKKEIHHTNESVARNLNTDDDNKLMEVDSTVIVDVNGVDDGDNDVIEVVDQITKTEAPVESSLKDGVVNVEDMLADFVDEV